MIKQLFDSVWFWLVVVITAMVMMMWVFNIQPIHPDKTMYYCFGVDVPQEIGAAQSESFCYCIKNNTQGSDEQKTQTCLKQQQSMQEHAQKVRHRLTKAP